MIKHALFAGALALCATGAGPAQAAPASAADVAAIEACALTLMSDADGSACEAPIMAACDDLYALCYERLLSAWDGLLNKSYRALQATLDREQRAALLAGQRAWLAYRDADCAAFGAMFPGIRPPFNEAACIHETTRERAIQLTRWRDAR